MKIHKIWMKIQMKIHLSQYRWIHNRQLPPECFFSSTQLVQQLFHASAPQPISEEYSSAKLHIYISFWSSLQMAIFKFLGIWDPLISWTAFLKMAHSQNRNQKLAGIIMLPHTVSPPCSMVGPPYSWLQSVWRLIQTERSLNQISILYGFISGFQQIISLRVAIVSGF